VKSEVQADVDALKKLLEDDDADKDALAAAVAKVGESSQKMGAAMYAASEAEASASEGATTEGEGASDDDVVDAEIVDEPGEDESK
jgi:molecular chaperone DnaK